MGATSAYLQKPLRSLAEACEDMRRTKSEAEEANCPHCPLSDICGRQGGAVSLMADTSGYSEIVREAQEADNREPAYVPERRVA